MPMYEYECRSCGVAFEALVRTGSEPACPACGSQDLERLLSLFAVSSEGTRQLAKQDGRRRGTRLRQEKETAEREHEKDHHH